jgi:hypothetical protein
MSDALPTLRISPTLLEAFRKFQSGKVKATDFHQQVLRSYPENAAMKLGKALHAFMHEPDTHYHPTTQTYAYGGIGMSTDNFAPLLEIRPAVAQEREAFRTYDIVEYNARCEFHMYLDVVLPDSVVDYKFTKRVGVVNYAQSLQGIAYMVSTGKQRMEFWEIEVCQKGAFVEYLSGPVITTQHLDVDSYALFVDTASELYAYARQSENEPIFSQAGRWIKKTEANATHS